MLWFTSNLRVHVKEKCHSLHGELLLIFYLMQFPTDSFQLWKSADTESLARSFLFPGYWHSVKFRGHCVLVAPYHVWAIFTLWFTFRKDNHVGNICRQLLHYTICSSSNPIFFFIYFVNIMWCKTEKLLFNLVFHVGKISIQIYIHAGKTSLPP